MTKFVTYERAQLAFQPNVMFASKAGACLSGAPFGYSPSWAGSITLGWKGLQGTNTLAYRLPP
jgi:hypothetical protein